MRTTITAVLAAAAGLAAPALAQNITTETIQSGLTRPVFATAPNGQFDRLYILEQRSGTQGRIRILSLQNNTMFPGNFLVIDPVSTGGEQGLLGLAFHPDFMNNGYFYVNYTRATQPGVSWGSTVVARYRATGGDGNALTADPASATILMTILQPDANHNGGWMDFGPDGHLYIATGDGGCANDNNCGGQNPTINPPGHTPGTGNAQDITSNLLGKVLRIDVDGPDNIPGNADDDQFPADPNRNYSIPNDNPFVGINGDDEIWSYGLRNPWRISFDRATGEMWIADVGQGQREEISVEPPFTAGGRNYGWRCLEGTRCTGLTGCDCADTSLIAPIHEYDHGGGRCSITGGYVYRGCAIPSLRGTYFFADYCSGDIYTLVRDGQSNTVTNVRTQLDPPGTATIDNVTSFAEDARGELYILDQTGGQIFRVVSTDPITDCNTNGREDACDIALGSSTDANGNGIPDECEPSCPADWDGSGGIDGDDITAFFVDWQAGEADIDGSGGTDGDDITFFFVRWQAGC